MERKQFFISTWLQRIFWIGWLLAGGLASLQASDDFIVHSYQAENGLSHNTVRCALQDSYGFIWFGTSNGLNCFDGREMTAYRTSSHNKEHSLGSNLIHSLFEDRQQQIWVGTHCGIYLYQRDRHRFSAFDLRTEFGVSISSEVSKMVQLPNGIIWIGTLGQGLFFYDPASHTLTQDNQHSSFIWDICTDEPGKVYTSSLQEGVLCFDTEKRFLGSYPLLPPQAASPQSYKANCLRSLNGKLWVGTDSKYLFCLEADGQMHPHALPDERFRIVHSLLPYDDHRLLVGTDNGLYWFEPRSHQLSAIENEQTPDLLSNLNINALMRDAEGGIWILTHMQGVKYMAPRSKSFQRVSSATCKAVNAFCETSDSTGLWIGARNGLFLYDKATKALKAQVLKDGQPTRLNDDVRTLCLNGPELWIGTFANGLKVLNTETGQWRHYHHSYQIPNTICSDEVQKIYRCRNGQVYIGTNWGLCYYDPEQDYFRPETAVGVMISITDIYEDSRNNLWIATANNGVFRYNRNKRVWRHYEHQRQVPHSLVHNSITTLFEDKDGVMWFGTNGNGLCSFLREQEQFMPFDASNPWLSSRVIYAIEQDAAGDLWISSHTGLICLHPTERQKYQQFTHTDGLLSNQFNECASWKDADGTLYFGETHGFDSFQPASFQSNMYIPPVYITRLSFQRTDDPEAAHRLLNLEQPLYLTRQVKIPYTYNSFTIHFAALSYQHPHKNQYAYKLEGVDTDWYHDTERNAVTYNNLPPGKYHLLVRGSNNDLQWNEQTAGLWIVITPPWWRSVWAYLIYIVLAGCLVAYLLRRRDRQLKHRYHQRMEEYQARKEKELYQSKVNFFINLVHEIRTPLSLIKLPLEELKRTFQAATDNKYLATIDKNVNYLLGVTNELLDFQKMESGCIQLHLQACNLSELVENVYQQFSGSADLGHLTLSLHLPEGTQPEGQIDPDKISKVLVNLLSNAMKYARTRIDVSVRMTSDACLIQVDDDGRGIAEAEREKIFEAFYQVNDSHAAPGTGIGLAYARSLAESHRGSLTVADSPQGGASFLLTLPLDRTPLAPEAPELLPDSNTCTAAQEAIASSDPLLQRTYTVLLVEDHTDLLNVTSSSLKQWFKVLKAKNGKQALQLLTEGNAIDVVVSDIMMPQMNGLELCETIKGTLEWSHIPVVLLTAKILPEAKAEGFAYGADAYMEKPFTIQQLCMQIRNLLKLRVQFHQRMQALVPQETPNLSEEAISISLKDQEFVARMQQIMEQQLSNESFSIDTLAAELHMSRSNFYRKLKALTGMSPNEYLKTCRLNKAAQLLREGARVTEVFEQTGFGSPSYFTKCFKAQFGVLPKEYGG